MHARVGVRVRMCVWEELRVRGRRRRAEDYNL